MFEAICFHVREVDALCVASSAVDSSVRRPRGLSGSQVEPYLAPFTGFGVGLDDGYGLSAHSDQLRDFRAEPAIYSTSLIRHAPRRRGFADLL